MPSPAAQRCLRCARTCRGWCFCVGRRAYGRGWPDDAHSQPDAARGASRAGRRGRVLPARTGRGPPAADARSMPGPRAGRPCPRGGAWRPPCTRPAEAPPASCWPDVGHGRLRIMVPFLFYFCYTLRTPPASICGCLVPRFRSQGLWAATRNAPGQPLRSRVRHRPARSESWRARRRSSSRYAGVASTAACFSPPILSPITEKVSPRSPLRERLRCSKCRGVALPACSSCNGPV